MNLCMLIKEFCWVCQLVVYIFWFSFPPLFLLVKFLSLICMIKIYFGLISYCSSTKFELTLAYNEYFCIDKLTLFWMKGRYNVYPTIKEPEAMLLVNLSPGHPLLVELVQIHLLDLPGMDLRVFVVPLLNQYFVIVRMVYLSLFFNSAADVLQG